MTSRRLASTVAVVFVLFLALPAFAEAPVYVPTTEVSLRGEVLYAGEDPSATGMFAIMRDGHNEIQVYIAPRAFLERQGIELKAGKTVTIVGSRTHFGGSEVILARQVTEGSKTVTVRNEDGSPRW